MEFNALHAQPHFCLAGMGDMAAAGNVFVKNGLLS